MAVSAWAEDDPPTRVARLAYIAGNVTFAPTGDDQWDQASINRPLTTGDRLLTEGDARAAMDTDGGDLRIGGDTGFNILRLDDSGTQIELSRGTLNWRVDRIGDGQNNEVDTPTIAFVASQPGTYKINVSEDGSYTTISIIQGAGTVYGEGGTSYPISGRQSWRFADSTLKDIAGMPLAQADDFDLWCNDRDASARRVVQNDYVSPDVVGYSDLSGNGDWDNVADYGNVWYPRTVVTGWAPYRYGHWAWVAPWGWTWIDDAPWGFAPFHYGRWVYVSNRWGWVPGPRHVRPVYCPAMVAFVGGNGWSASISSGRPVAWVALGPRDVYVPWYRGSQHYVTNINVNNVRNIDRVHINNVYNDYRGNRGDRISYMNREAPGGTTAVPRDAFTRGNRVNGAQVHLDRAQWDRAQAMPLHELPSGRPNIGLRASGSNRGAPSQEFKRPPVLFRTPPQTSLGAREPGRNTSASPPSFGDGRDTPFNRGSNNNRDDNRNRRDNNDANDRINVIRAPQNNGVDRRDNSLDRRDEGPNRNAGPQGSPQAPAQTEQDPRWNNRAQRNIQPREDAMPSSRFNPWRDRDPSNGRNPAPQADNPAQAPSSEAVPAKPLRLDNNGRWGNNAQRSNDSDGNRDKPLRLNPWQQQTREQPQPQQQQQQQPPQQQEQQQPAQRSPQHFGFQGQRDNSPRPAEPQNIPQPAPREQQPAQQLQVQPRPQPQPQPQPQQQAPRENGQRGTPFMRQMPEMGGQHLNRGEQHRPPPAPQERQ